MRQEEAYYAYWLSSLPGIGNRTIERLMETCGSAEQIYMASEAELKQVLHGKQLESLKTVKRAWKLEEAYERLITQKIGFTWQGSENYPERLCHIPDAPFALFYKGGLPQSEVPAVAVIGARECSQYGSYVAAELGKYLGQQGIQVISGMARGIDGISQEEALKAGGISFGVLGCGVDICYPEANRGLYEKLLQRGGVLSSYLPGTLPAARNFPPRNRIVSGLCDAVVVIEARSRSGTLITVDMALEQGKEVYVVPGRVTDRLSDGCNRLLKQGAGLFLSPQDFVEELGELGKPQKNQEFQGGSVNRMVQNKQGELSGKARISALSEEEQLIYRLLDFSPQPIEKIAGRLSESIPLSRVSMILIRLCMEGYAVQISPGRFCVRGQ